MKSPYTKELIAISNLTLHLIQLKDIRSYERLMRHTPEQRLKVIFQELPKCGKVLDQYLAMGIWTPLLRSSSIELTKKRKIPYIMFDIINTISYYSEGEYYIRELDDSLIALVKQWRNIYYLCYKYEPTSTDEDLIVTVTEKAWHEYCERDDSVKTTFTDQQITALRDSMNRCFNLNGHHFDILPRFSSGATADKASKLKRRLTLNPYHASTFAGHAMSLSDWRQYTDSIDVIGCKPDSIHEPSRFTTVPKDTRGPRAICMEPSSRIVFQLGLMYDLYDWIENYSPAKGYVNFTDQTVNQRMSYRGSINGHWSTIDLKDASDMVSNELVKAVMPEPLNTYLQDLRSETVEFGARTRKLNKYASMGSALCFPVEAMVFYAIVRMHCAMAFVYGDDIIVPTHLVHDVLKAISEYGLKVNEGKTFVTGKFRESCGTDWYNGRLITPIRLRGSDLESICSFLTQWEEQYGYNEEFVKLVQSMHMVESELTDRGLRSIPRMPLSYKDSGAIAYYTVSANRPKFKLPANNPLKSDYHYPTFRALVRSTEAENIITDRKDWDQYDDLYLELVGVKGQYAKYSKRIFKFTVKSSSEYLYDMINRIEYSLMLRKMSLREDVDPVVRLLNPVKSVFSVGDVRNTRLRWKWLSAKTESLW